MKNLRLKGPWVLCIIIFVLGALLITGCTHPYSLQDGLDGGGLGKGSPLTAPGIQSTSPVDGAIKVPIAAEAVSVTFTKDIRLSEGAGVELADSDFDSFDMAETLPRFIFGSDDPSGGGEPPESSPLVTDAAYDTESNTLTLTLDTLGYSTQYYLTIDGVYGLTGLALEKTVVSFTTAGLNEKVVSAGGQNGALTGYTAGSATYDITTANVDDNTQGSVTWYTTATSEETTTAPEGLSVSFGALTSGKATLTLTATSDTPVGFFYFTVTFDGEESEIGVLYIKAPEATNYGSAILPTGSNLAYIGNSVIKDFGERIAAGNAPGVITTYPMPTAGTVYYVSPTGSDNFDGKSPATAWKSIQKVNSVSSFNNGDQILFRAGGTWQLNYDTTGPLHPKGSGITIGAYGAGPKPQLVGITSGDPTDIGAIFLHDVIFLLDQENIEIRDLDIRNGTTQYTGATANDSTEKNMARDRRGIHITVSISTSAAKTLRNYNIHDCYIHNILGSGTGVSNGTPWDITKRGSGLLFETVRLDSGGKPIMALSNSGMQITIETNRVVTGVANVDTSGYQPAWFENITIENNVFRQNAFSSITFKQLSKWGVRADSGSEPYFNSNSADWKPHKNVVIQDNYIDHYGWERSADGIYCTNVGNGIIRRNVLYGCGTSAIEMYNTDTITVERNEVYDTVQKVTGADSNAIDPDRKSTNILIQYNYIYNSNEGILLCEFNYGNVVVRYNVLKDCGKNSRQYINLHGNKGKRYIYNNVFYHSLSSATKFIYSSGGVSTYFNDSDYLTWIYNNVFYSPNATGTFGDGSSVYYSNNWYGGSLSGRPSEDTAGITGTGAPGFINLPGLTGGKGKVVNLDGLMLTDTSPLRGAGADIAAAFKNSDNNHNGTLIPITDIKDLNGVAVQNPVDIGVFRNGSTATVTGVNLSPSSLTVYQGKTGTLTAAVIPAAATNKNVTWQTSNGSVASITGSGLSVTINGLSQGTSNITVTTAEGGYSKTATVTVEPLPLKTVSGTVTSGGSPVAGVTVTISDGGGVSKSAQTVGNGTYSIADVPAGDGYTVIAAKTGYESFTVNDYSVPGTGTPAAVDFSLISLTHVYYDEPFDNLTDWTVTTNDSAQVIEIITDPEDSTNKLLHINKGGDKAKTFSVKNSTAARAYGTFTYETRWKRSYSGANAGQYQIYTNEEGSSDPVADIMMDTRNIFVHGVQGGSTRNSLGTYAADTWYSLALCVDTTTDTFRAYVDGEEKLSGTTLYLRNVCDYIDFFSISCGNANYDGYGDWWIDYIKIYQGEPQFPDVDGVSLNKDTLSLSTTGKGTLSAAVTPTNAGNRAVTWESSDTNVATVTGTGSTVTINGVGAGTATITVTTADGGLIDTASVTVGDNLVPAAGVSIVEEDFSLAPDGTKSLTAIVTPSEAAQSVTWTSGTLAAATVSGTGLSATVTGVANGTSVITASAGSVSDTVMVTVEAISYTPVNLVIRNQAASPGTGTTANNSSLLQLTSTDGVTWSWTGSQTVTNAETTSVGDAGIGAYTFGYVNYSLGSTDKYTFTAKIALTSGNLMVADFTNPGSAAASGYMNFMGMRNINGAAKYYYGASNNKMSAPESNNATLTAGTVYTYVITFNGTRVYAKIMDSAGTTVVRAEYSRPLTDANSTIKSHSTPRPGFAAGAGSITISELTLTLDE